MKILFIISITVIVVTVFCMPAETNQPGAAQSRPNASGGYDFLDETGAKTGSSAKRSDGGYDYFDQFGNKTGSIVKNPETNSYEYSDAEDIGRGSITTDPYGGYRYKTKGEDTITAEQTNIRRSYGYTDTYGSGMETLSSDTLRGIEGTSQPASGGSSIGAAPVARGGLSTPVRTGGSGSSPPLTAAPGSGLSIPITKGTRRPFTANPGSGLSTESAK